MQRSKKIAPGVGKPYITKPPRWKAGRDWIGMLCIMQAEVLKFNLNNLAYEVLITLGTRKKDEREAV